eukprot:1178483-Prorocentrum_minimum.AAC.6
MTSPAWLTLRASALRFGHGVVAGPWWPVRPALKSAAPGIRGSWICDAPLAVVGLTRWVR